MQGAVYRVPGNGEILRPDMPSKGVDQAPQGSGQEGDKMKFEPSICDYSFDLTGLEVNNLGLYICLRCSKYLTMRAAEGQGWRCCGQLVEPMCMRRRAMPNKKQKQTKQSVTTTLTYTPPEKDLETLEREKDLAGARLSYAQTQQQKWRAEEYMRAAKFTEAHAEWAKKKFGFTEEQLRDNPPAKDAQ